MSSSQADGTRMLIVEDDPDVGEALHDYFEYKGYTVAWAEEGEKALEMMKALPPYDVVLLDVMLPKKDGFEVLREARRAEVTSPVIMLTAKGQDTEKLQGFRLGADDYVTKPFSAEELAARVTAVIRRSKTPAETPTDTFQFGDMEVDFPKHTVRKKGEPIELTALEFNILRYLIQHRGRAISRTQLLREVWGISGDITTRTVDRHVASLRKKVESNPHDPRFIETVYGVGYKFVG